MNLVDCLTDIYYDENFYIEINETSMNLTKVSGKSWRQKSFNFGLIIQLLVDNIESRG